MDDVVFIKRTLLEFYNPGDSIATKFYEGWSLVSKLLPQKNFYVAWGPREFPKYNPNFKIADNGRYQEVTEEVLINRINSKIDSGYRHIETFSFTLGERNIYSRLKMDLLALRKISINLGARQTTCLYDQVCIFPETTWSHKVRAKPKPLFDRVF